MLMKTKKMCTNSIEGNATTAEGVTLSMGGKDRRDVLRKVDGTSWTRTDARLFRYEEGDKMWFAFTKWGRCEGKTKRAVLRGLAHLIASHEADEVLRQERFDRAADPPQSVATGQQSLPY